MTRRQHDVDTMAAVAQAVAAAAAAAASHRTLGAITRARAAS